MKVRHLNGADAETPAGGSGIALSRYIALGLLSKTCMAVAHDCLLPTVPALEMTLSHDILRSRQLCSGTYARTSTGVHTHCGTFTTAQKAHQVQELERVRFLTGVRGLVAWAGSLCSLLVPSALREPDRWSPAACQPS